jgi:galactokinase
MLDPDAARTAFAARFGVAPSAMVRAPGRVNLIGEHTDYCGLPVLPIAIDRALLIAASATDSPVLTAVSDSFHGEASLVRGAGRTPGEPWHRYLTGALAAFGDAARGRGANIAISGDLPGSGGLSSSSALTLGVIAALSAVWGEAFDPAAAALAAGHAERTVGVETGGMDQLVIALAKAGNALRIDFLPPAQRDVPLPEGLAFVVAYSGEEAPKGGAVRDAYNERVVGTRIAALMLADMLGLDIDGPLLLGAVADVDAAPVMVEELPEQMAPRNAANNDAAALDRVVSLSAAHFDSTRKVPVKRLARHVLSEAERVDAAEIALASGDLAAFGKLLNDSHDSLRNDYRCSTPALDKVAAAMRKAGALGARLTGAGFGGYALAACSPDRVAAVTEAAIAATGGPAFEVNASDGLTFL